MTSDLRETVSKRYRVLQALADDPRTKPELVDRLECSRSTVDRATSDLLDVECIESTDVGGSRFRLTQTGRVALEVERRYRDDADRLAALSALLNDLPSDAPMSEAFVSGADVYRSARAPDVALRPATELLVDADRMVGTATVVRNDYFDNLGGRLDDGGFELELVLDPELLAGIVENHDDEFERLLARDGVEAYTAETTIPYALWLTENGTDATAGITVHDDGGVKGTVVNGSARAVSWARSQYVGYRDAATKLTQLPES